MKKVGFIGWRGMVGSVLIKSMIDESDFKNLEPYFFSTSQAGQKNPEWNIKYKNELLIDAYNIEELSKMDIVITCQGGEYTDKVFSKLRKSGWNGHWVDAASSLRMKKDSVIVLDPINQLSIDEAYDKGIKNWVGGNCTVSLMLLAIHGLLKEDLVEWVSSMTYQAASGAGAKNMRELLLQMGQIYSSVSDDLIQKDLNILDIDGKAMALMNSGNFQKDNFKVPLAGNLIPWIDEDLNNGQSREEWKGQSETNKILSSGFKSIKVDGLCVRIGTMRSHAQALTIKLKKNIPIETINKIISNGNQWVKLIQNDKKSSMNLLSPAAVSGKLDIAVGRIRKLDIEENCISVFTVGDQLLWGAAEPIRRMLKILIKKGR
ncbi:aspartate-semialdehyde dehydrogenase [Methylophilaceae bacterium]|jgi:aspartate-semialdehyde dehydrogenase|nr:aspartate-semialdehyde dehydrogenase [Methylophilaceae bacterium]|tara:strand:+ start:721 stop:1845 length:1125 start_codon:yes stop_codon:yes gene_type:complete